MNPHTKAKKALESLIGYGSTSYKTPGDPAITPGKKIGMALARLGITPSNLLDVAGEGLEDLNHHLDAAIVRAVRDGHVTVTGRIVTVKLGKEWA